MGLKARLVTALWFTRENQEIGGKNCEDFDTFSTKLMSGGTNQYRLMCVADSFLISSPEAVESLLLCPGGADIIKR